MEKKQSRIFQLVMVVFLFSIVFLSAILNAYTFRSNAVTANTENTAAVLSMLIERSEYGLKYGRELSNYYDIESVLSDIEKYCGTEHKYIITTEGELLYGGEVPEDIRDHIEELKESGEKYLFWEDDGMQHILMEISGKQEAAGYVGVFYPVNVTGSFSDAFVKSILLRALLFAVLGVLLFAIVFRVVKHHFEAKKIKILVMGTVLVVSAAMVVSTWTLFRQGYVTLSERVTESILDVNANNMKRLVESGVYYSDIRDTEEYYERISSSSEQLEKIAVTETPDAGEGIYVELPVDGAGNSRYMTAVYSLSYVRSKVRTAVLNVIVTMVTALMIASEVVGFLLDILIGEKRERRKLVTNNEHRTIEGVGVVRGISFFFAAFRFMAVAFMSIVLTEIYQPVYVFGHEIPFEILMSFPMTAQVSISMITSYLSGSFINKRGWKASTLGGISVMVLGTLASSFARAPIPFILAQMLIGVGLGFAKMGIDIYAVVVSSEEDMALYTAGSNAAIIVGYSCSASIGALIASSFGYSGAYLVMTAMGICVFILASFFGMNVAPREEKEEEAADKVNEWTRKGPDLRFPIYILCIIIPYYFVMMFVDYFFPVYANSVGVTTEVIGYVMLIYGIATAYVGAGLCPKLTKRFSSSVLMPAILLGLSVGVTAFALRNMVAVAVILVLLIGTADGIMPSAQFEYVYALPFAKKVGFSKALGIEGFFSNLIGAIAPVVFGVVMVYGSRGLIVVGGAIIVASALFLVVNGGFRKGGAS